MMRGNLANMGRDIPARMFSRLNRSSSAPSTKIKPNQFITCESDLLFRIPLEFFRFQYNGDVYCYEVLIVGGGTKRKGRKVLMKSRRMELCQY